MSDDRHSAVRSFDICPLVEAPGTAPGSAGFITMAVYRHSRIAPTGSNIGIPDAVEKACRRPGQSPEMTFHPPDVATADFVVEKSQMGETWSRPGP